MKRPSYTCYKNNSFLGRRNEYPECLHRKPFHDPKCLPGRHPPVGGNANLRKHDTGKTGRIQIRFPRGDLPRRKLDRPFAVGVESVLDCLGKDAEGTNTEACLHY